jgi:hypothetical protein
VNLLRNLSKYILFGMFFVPDEIYLLKTDTQNQNALKHFLYLKNETTTHEINCFFLLFYNK